MHTTMSPRKIFTLVAGLCLVGLTVLSAPAQDAPQTLANLMAAYNGEMNANAKYTAFAERADEEGYAGVAALFRATARAEEVHAGNHAEAIQALGGSPEATIELPPIGTTAENLQMAIEGETYERDTMYPEFLATARQERIVEAVRSFNYAVTAEAEHAALYQEALDNLESWREAVPWYVCTVCGWTTRTLPAQRCPACFQSVDVYEEIL